MAKFHLIMPMGGNGSRFSKNGYIIPKPLIEIYGKPFFYWACESLNRFNDVIDITFVVLKEHVEKFNIDKKILEYYKDANIIVLDHVLNGPVLTCLEGIKTVQDDFPILFNDCDHLFKSTEFNNACKEDEILKIGGALITFNSNLPQYSYVRYDGIKIIGTIEKEVASNNAICGAYLFKNARQFRKLSKSYLNNCNYKEYFISGMYNEMAKFGYEIKTYNVDYHVSFGIPEEYEEALKDTHYLEL